MDAKLNGFLQSIKNEYVWFKQHKETNAKKIEEYTEKGSLSMAFYYTGARDSSDIAANALKSLLLEYGIEVE